MSTSTDLDQADVVPSLAEFASELAQDLETLPSSGLARLPDGAMPASSSDFNAASAAFPQAPPHGFVQGDVDNIVMDIPVTIKVVLGSTRMPVAAVSKLARGTVIKLDNNVGDPVDIYVNGRFLARGQVVVLDEGASRFGVTLTQVGGANGVKR